MGYKLERRYQSWHNAAEEKVASEGISQGKPWGGWHLKDESWASHAETCSIKKVELLIMLKEQVVNGGRSGWPTNRGGQRCRKKEQWSDLRSLTMVRHLDFILSAVRSHWGWRLFSLLVLSCESILLIDIWRKSFWLFCHTWQVDLWNYCLIFDQLGFFHLFKVWFCLFTKPWSCVDCTSVTICFLELSKDKLIQVANTWLYRKS